MHLTRQCTRRQSLHKTLHCNRHWNQQCNMHSNWAMQKAIWIDNVTGTEVGNAIGTAVLQWNKLIAPLVWPQHGVLKFHHIILVVNIVAIFHRLGCTLSYYHFMIAIWSYDDHNMIIWCIIWSCGDHCITLVVGIDAIIQLLRCTFSHHSYDWHACIFLMRMLLKQMMTRTWWEWNHW